MQMKINNDTYEVITSQDITNIEKAVDKSALTMPLVAVYCGSRLGNNEVYEQAARELRGFAEHRDAILAAVAASTGTVRSSPT